MKSAGATVTGLLRRHIEYTGFDRWRKYLKNRFVQMGIVFTCANCKIGLTAYNNNEGRDSRDPAMSIPVLYSERECPYSIRARMALAYAGMHWEHREVRQKSPPAEVMEMSATNRIPLLQVIEADPLDHSLDIMHWALLQSDPEGWLDYEVDELEEMQGLIRINDSSFAQDVMRYVTWDEYSEKTREAYRKDCELFLTGLEEHLTGKNFLFGDRVSMADYAIFPFVRLFSQVKLEWFRKALYPNVWKWLEYFANSPLFLSIMKEYPEWESGQDPVIFEYNSAAQTV